ncbi:hypothetical protein chiPu_0023964 [Chiloscyllium punctatum]|uniref:Uncharacterized protein n=1 Tax=Chiloscyllium punctatum TaxID=137246 RepID=A0A401TBZ7_CHIPU|nr:hypothetical protein [Chiloscyllium punctatum]
MLRCRKRCARRRKRGKHAGVLGLLRRLGLLSSASPDASSQVLRCRKRPVRKQMKTWPAGAISALRDCFERTDWYMFREVATDGDSINFEE